MTHSPTMPGTLREEMASHLPRYDPLEERRSRAGLVMALVSVLVHLLALWVFWDAVIGALQTIEETVTVEMFEPEQEQPKLQRKVLAQTRVDTTVQQFKEIVQPEIVERKTVELNADLQRVEVDQVEVTEAPKKIENRAVEAKSVSVFADRPVTVAQRPVTTAPSAPKRIQAARPTTGPQVMKAAGPVTNARAAEVSAPTIAAERIGNTTAGDVDGAEVADVHSGMAEAALRGAGDRGALATQDKDCNDDPVCKAYLAMIRRRVYARWNTPQNLAGGEVRLKFRVDRGGSAHDIEVDRADDAGLGDSCMTAFRHASPFPPPPKEIHYLIGKRLLATFTASDVEE